MKKIIELLKIAETYLIKKADDSEHELSIIENFYLDFSNLIFQSNMNSIRDLEIILSTPNGLYLEFKKYNLKTVNKEDSFDFYFNYNHCIDILKKTLKKYIQKYGYPEVNDSNKKPIYKFNNKPSTELNVAKIVSLNEDIHIGNSKFNISKGTGSTRMTIHTQGTSKTIELKENDINKLITLLTRARDY